MVQGMFKGILEGLEDVQGGLVWFRGCSRGFKTVQGCSRGLRMVQGMLKGSLFKRVQVQDCLNELEWFRMVFMT